MKEKLTNNLTLKLLSIVLAFLIWMGVLYIANPVETMKVRVNVDVVNEDVLARQAKTYDAADLSAVYAQVSVRKLDREWIRSDNFRATIDLSKIYEVTGAVPINIEIIKNHDLIEGEPVAVPKTVLVKIEDIMEKAFVLEANTLNEPASGYTVGEIEVEPKMVVLKGAESVIGRISSVGIEVDVSEAKADLKGEAEIICYDANHSPLKIDFNSVEPSQKNIVYHVKVLTGKSLPLEYEVSGEPANGYKFVGAESMTKSIAITGTSDAIEKISSIPIPKEVLNVSGLIDNKTVTVDIEPYLPEGVYVDGSTYVDVVLKIEAKSTQSITLNQYNIIMVGQNSGYLYDISPKSITVSVSGLTSDINTIHANSLGARINVSNLTPGSHPGSITFNNPDNIEIDSHSPFVINVKEAQRDSVLETVQQAGDTESAESSETTATTETKSEATSDSVKQESIKQESTKQESTKQDSTKQDTLKQESTKQDSVRQESTKSETSTAPSTTQNSVGRSGD